MGDLTIRGGRGGVTADLTDMRRVAEELDRAGDRLRRLAGEARRLTRDGDLLASAVLSPLTAANATAHLLDASFGPDGTTTVAVALEAGAVGLRGVADLFAAGDRATAALVDARETAGATLLLSSVPVLAAGGIQSYLARLVQGSGAAAWTASGGLLRGELTLDEALALLGDVSGGANHGMVQGLHELLLSHPELTDTLTGGTPWLLRGVSGAVDAASPLDELLGVALPGDYEDLTNLIVAAGQLAGRFEDGQVTVTASTDRPPVALASLRDLMVGQDLLMETVRHDPDRSAIRVIRVRSEGDPAWVVQVPGTQEWGLRAGADPSDLTSNLLLEGRHDAELLDAIAEAMRRSGVMPGDPVLLTGHSQGGIAAAAFASHPEHGQDFNVTHVVTAGSPIARLAIPADVEVLALEHAEDPVPRLEGDPNPDVPNLTTVTRSVEEDVRREAAELGLDLDVIRAHGIDLYAATAAAVDGDDDPGLRAFVDSASGFLTGAGDPTDHTIQRSQP